MSDWSAGSLSMACHLHIQHSSSLPRDFNRTVENARRVGRTWACVLVSVSLLVRACVCVCVCGWWSDEVCLNMSESVCVCVCIYT